MKYKKHYEVINFEKFDLIQKVTVLPGVATSFVCEKLHFIDTWYICDSL